MLLLLACHAQKPQVAGDTEPVTWTPDSGIEIIDPTEFLYDDARMHEVEVTLAAEDWESLRRQDRSILDMFEGSCMSEPFDSPFTWFDAAVVFDGVDLPKSVVKKKGLLGSLSYDRPSLRIETDHYDDDDIEGATSLTLNNNNQDPSSLRTCLTYQLFRSAGLVAPRCALAHVTVNGEDLGLYSHVEPVSPEMIARWRGAEPETLYEGTLSDLREGWIDTFDAKTDDSDRQDLSAVAAILADADDDALIDALDPVVDLDSFFGFWAAEALVAHWDGYSSNTNNFFVYRDGVDGKLRFAPWGPDAALQAETTTTWVFASGYLSNRLIATADGRARYGAAMTSLLDEAWPAADLVAREKALAALTEPYRSAEGGSSQTELRRVLRGRDAAVRAAMDAYPGTVDVDPRAASCFVDHGTLRLDFETTWGSYGSEDYYSYGSGSFEADWDGASYDAAELGVTAGEYNGEGILLAIGAIAPDTYLAPYFTLDPAVLAPGEVAVDGLSVLGALLYADPSTDWTTAAYLGESTLILDEAGSQPGDVVRGHLEAPILGW